LITIGVVVVIPISVLILFDVVLVISVLILLRVMVAIYVSVWMVFGIVIVVPVLIVLGFVILVLVRISYLGQNCSKRPSLCLVFREFDFLRDNCIISN
jgi:uncharacterized membrane-anchored protein